MREHPVAFEEDRVISLQQFKRRSTIIERVLGRNMPCDMCGGKMLSWGYAVVLGAGAKSLWLCHDCLETLRGQIAGSLHAEECARRTSPFRDEVVRKW